MYHSNSLNITHRAILLTFSFSFLSLLLFSIWYQSQIDFGIVFSVPLPEIPPPHFSLYHPHKASSTAPSWLLGSSHHHHGSLCRHQIYHLSKFSDHLTNHAPPLSGGSSAKPQNSTFCCSVLAARFISPPPRFSSSHPDLSSIKIW